MPESVSPVPYIPHPAWFAFMQAVVQCDASELAWDAELAFETWKEVNGVEI